MNPDEWQVTVDAATIEDIIDNAQQQISGASLDDLFAAFTFYIENDAFKVF